MPRRRTAFNIPEDVEDDYTENSRLTHNTHSSGLHASERHSRHHDRKKHSRSHRRREPDDSSKSRKHRSKNRHKEHRHHSRSREKDRSWDDDDEADEDYDDEDQHRAPREHRSHRHRTHKDSHRHHSRKHSHRSKHHHSSSHRRHDDDHEEDYYDDVDDMAREPAPGRRMRHDGHGEGIALRTRATHADEDEDEDVEDHYVSGSGRMRSHSHGGRRGETLDAMFERHAKASRRLYRGERLDDQNYADEGDPFLGYNGRTSASASKRYTTQRTDYCEEEGDLDQERASEISRRRSYRGRRATEEHESHRDRGLGRRGEGSTVDARGGYEEADDVRDNGHDDDMGNGFTGRGMGEDHRRARSRSRSRRSRSRGRYGDRPEVYEEQRRDYPHTNVGRGYGRTGMSRDEGYPEGTMLSEEGRFHGLPRNGSHRTPSGYPLDDPPYDMGIHDRGNGPRFAANAPRWQSRHSDGLGQGAHNFRVPPYGYNVGPGSVRPGGGSFGIIGGPGYRMNASQQLHPNDFVEGDFEHRSELSDDLGTAEMHARMVRRARREKERSRRHYYSRRSRHHKHRRHGRHRHSKHRSHRRHRGSHSSYSRRHRDLTRTLSEGSQLSEDMNEAEYFDENANAEMDNRQFPLEGGANAEEYEGNRFDVAGDFEEQSEPRKKIFTKRNAAKAGMIALAAIAAGLLARRIAKKRKAKKQAEEEWSDNEEATVDENGMPIMPSFRSPPLPVPGMFSVKVPQNQAVIIERGGKYHRKLDAGNNPITPCVDKVAYCHSLKELRVPIPYQQCYARENIPLRANGVLFMKIEDPVAATYDVDNPYRTAVHLTQTCIRNEIAKMTVQEAMEERTAISDRVLDRVNDACRPWGVRCMRFELQDLELPEDMKDSIEKEAEAERQRRLKVLESEAEREEAINRAEGQLQAQMRMSQARQLDIVNQAIGEAHAIEERGQAVAHAMRDVLEVIREPGGEQAMQMRIAEQYINAYTNATREPSIRPPEPNNMAATMNNALDLLTTLGENGNIAQIPLADLPAENPFDSISEGQAPANGNGSNAERLNGAVEGNERENGNLGNSGPSTPPGLSPNGDSGPVRPTFGTPVPYQQAGGIGK